MLGQLHRVTPGTHENTSTAASAGPGETGAARHWLSVARMAWAVAAVLSAGWFLIKVALGYGQLTHVTPEVRHALAQAGFTPAQFTLLHLSLDGALVTVFTAVGWLIYLKRRGDWMALLTALALVVWGPHNGLLVGTGYTPPVSGPLSLAGAATVGLMGYGSWMLFFYLFPSGRFVPSWTRLCAVTWVVMVFLWSATPVGPPHWPKLPRLLLVIALWGSFPVSQIYRYWRVSTPTQRLQTKWVVFGIALGVTGFTLSSHVIGALSGPLPTEPVRQLIGSGLDDVFIALIPLSMGIAILKHRLFDIDLILNRTLVYGALTALVVGGYVVIVGVLGALFQARGNLALSLLATAAVAVLFQPGRQWLQKAANHLLYGERDDPYALISNLGRQLEAALAPEAVLPTMATTIREALKLPYVAIAPDGNVGMVAAGEPRGELLHVPLTHAGKSVGQLILSARSPGETFSAAESRLLDDVANSAGAAVQSARLTRQLQHSREQLVLAREEERRRLRRDLHDDLAPSLAALALTASTAGDLIPYQADTGRRLVEELRQGLRLKVGEVRRIAHDLRPPTLDELGLIAAIREQAERYTGMEGAEGAGGSPLQVMVDVPVQLPPLTAAAEVAAFRIIQEGLTNVARHAHARHCLIRLVFTEISSGSILEVSVGDDGVGLPVREGSEAAGLGLRSMRERASELGGSCMIERSPEGGTCVRASLPIPGGKEEADGRIARLDH